MAQDSTADTLLSNAAASDSARTFPEYVALSLRGIQPSDISRIHRHQVCTLELRPVCGCDNETYSNPCDAYSSGVSILHLGECEGAFHQLAFLLIRGDSRSMPDNTFACFNNSDCLVNEYCRYPSSQCGGKGTCVASPRVRKWLAWFVLSPFAYDGDC